MSSNTPRHADPSMRTFRGVHFDAAPPSNHLACWKAARQRTKHGIHSRPFCVAFHTPRPLDLQLHAHRALALTRFAEGDDRLPEVHNIRSCFRDDVCPSDKPPFVSAWHIPRERRHGAGSDARLLTTNPPGAICPSSRPRNPEVDLGRAARSV